MALVYDMKGNHLILFIVSLLAVALLTGCKGQSYDNVTLISDEPVDSVTSASPDGMTGASAVPDSIKELEAVEVKEYKGSLEVVAEELRIRN